MVRRTPLLLMVFAVSRKKAKSGLKAGRQAAMIPVFSSMLLVISILDCPWWLKGLLLVPNLEGEGAAQKSISGINHGGN